MREVASELLQYYFHKYKLSTVLEKKKKKVQALSSTFSNLPDLRHLTCKPSTLLSDGEQPSADQQQCFGPDFGKSGTALGTPPSHTLSARDSMLERRPQCLGMGKICVSFKLSSSKICRQGTTGWHQLCDAHRDFSTFLLTLSWVQLCALPGRL